MRTGPAVVVSAGKMQRTVKCRQTKQIWNRHLRKNFYRPANFFVNDRNNSLVEGDIISLAPERHTKHVAYTVNSIVVPFGKPVEERPPIWTPEQREAFYEEKRIARRQRKAERGVANEVEKAIAEDIDFEQKRPKNDPERPKDAMGRSVLPGGLHRYGGKGEGGINKEASAGAERARRRLAKGAEHEKDKEEIEKTPWQQVARDKLDGKR